MNWYLKHIVAVNQQILNLLKQKQVSQEVIQFIQSLPDNQAGKYISALMRNPSLSLQDLQNMGKPKEDLQLVSVARVLGVKPEQLSHYLIKSEPTSHGEYKTWILRQVKERKLRLPEDAHRIQESLSKFHRLKSNPNYEFEKNIHKYSTLHDLEEMIDSLNSSGSKSQGYLQVNPLSLPGVNLFRKSENYTVYMVFDADSLAEMGEGTKWCTRKSYKDCQAETYIEDYGKIYIVTDKSGKLLYQYTPDFSQFMDINDNAVENPNDEIKELVRPDIRYTDVESFSNYILNINNKPWPEVESVIMKDPELAYSYARFTIKRRWYKAEPYIMKSPAYAYHYAKDIIKDRWPEAEPYIMKNNGMIYQYARYVIEDRWTEAEPYIMKDATWAYIYAKNIIKGRWQEAEPYIRKSNLDWHKYFRDVLKYKD